MVEVITPTGLADGSKSIINGNNIGQVISSTQSIASQVRDNIAAGESPDNNSIFFLVSAASALMKAYVEGDYNGTTLTDDHKSEIETLVTEFEAFTQNAQNLPYLLGAFANDSESLEKITQEMPGYLAEYKDAVAAAQQPTQTSYIIPDTVQGADRTALEQGNDSHITGRATTAMNDIDNGNLTNENIGFLIGAFSYLSENGVSDALTDRIENTFFDMDSDILFNVFENEPRYDEILDMLMESGNEIRIEREAAEFQQKIKVWSIRSNKRDTWLTL